MRITAAEKAANRAAILETAGRLFRERGIPNVGIADLMREAGFTHGGFYNHFPSKEALVAEVCASNRVRGSLAAGLAGPDPDAAWHAFVEEYLSPEHRDAPGEGCTVAALAGDAAHEPACVQETLAQSCQASVEIIGAYFSRRYRLDAEAGRRRALEAMTAMLGAVTLARAVARADPTFSDEVLATCRARLLR